MSEEKDISAMPPEELQSAVQSILKDPAFAKLVGELSGKTPAAEEKPEDSAVSVSESSVLLSRRLAWESLSSLSTF